MTDTKLTPTRAAVLQGVADGQVAHHGSYDLWTWMAGATRKVTTDIGKLYAAGLIEIRPGNNGAASQPWSLTATGVAWLAQRSEEDK